MARYQDKKSANKKSATLGVSQKAYPNSAEKTYFWNQATIHHFVWSSKERLVQLATAPKKSPNGQNHGVGWISVVTSIHGSGPSWVSQYPAAYDYHVPDDWQTVEDALKVARIPIVCVGGMTIKSPTHEYDFGEIRLRQIGIPTTMNACSTLPKSKLRKLTILTSVTRTAPLPDMNNQDVPERMNGAVHQFQRSAHQIQMPQAMRWSSAGCMLILQKKGMSVYLTLPLRWRFVKVPTGFMSPIRGHWTRVIT